MEWLTAKGALVWIPLGHSPDVDVIAQFEDRLIRIQVKTSTFRGQLRGGDIRWRVAISTSGGNQSWNKTVKRFDPEKVDYLFVLTGDGRRWYIPASCVEAGRLIGLGGRKYSEFEIEPGTAIDSLIYAESGPNRIIPVLAGECQSGQMDLTVNQAAYAYAGSNPASPITASRQVLLRPKRQVTIPKLPAEEAGVEAGDRLRVRADGPGRIVFERI